MKFKILYVMEKMPEEYFDVDDLLVYLKLCGIESTRHTVQNRLSELYSHGLIKRRYFGVYQWSDHESEI